MKRHIVSRTERNVLSALRRWNKDAPEEVLTAEARYRLQRVVLDAAEAGDTQQAIAERLGYSVSQVERILNAARRDRANGRVPPLTAWRSRRTTHEPAPAPEAAFTPADEPSHDEVMAALDADLAERQANIVTIGVDTQPPMTARAIAWAGADQTRSWILTLDGNALSLAGVPATPEPAPPTDADRALFATIHDRGPMLTDAVRLLQHAAGLPATGRMDDDTMSVVAGLAAWQSRPRPLMDAVAGFVDGARASDRLSEGVLEG